MKNRVYWLILVLILGSFTMGACTALSAPKPTATATAPAGIPIGIYKPDQMLYSDMLQFNADGTYVSELLSAQGADRHEGHYDVSGDQIVFNAYDGLCVSNPGTYQWTMDGNILHLKPINDTCTNSSRAEDMGGRAWILQP
jgi:hypothetical protein